MSAITYLTSIVTSLTNRFNLLEANSKKVDELPVQTTLEPSSKIPVSRAGESEHITVQQIISSIQNSNYNQLTSVGAITVDGTDLIVEPVSGQINGSLYTTTTDTTIPITLCDAGFNRKDILVLTTSNTVVAISGEETDGAIVIAPPTPLDAIYITEFDVSDSLIGAPIDPVLGTSFKKKSEAAAYNDPTLTGSDAVIPLQPNGQSVYAFSNAGLTSIDGFGLSLITGNPTAEVPYDGKDILIYNNKAGNLTLKHDGSGSADVKFLLEGGVDLVIPLGGKVWLKYGPSYCEMIFKSWSEVDLSAKADLVGGKVPASQLPAYVDDVLEFANLSAFPVTGETGKIYIALDTTFTYRWSGSAYVQLSAGIDFPIDGKTYGVKDGIPVELLSELYRSWFSYMANNAGAWLTLNTGNPLSVSGTSAVVPRSGTSIYGSIIMNNCVSATTNGSNAGIKNNNSSDGVYREGVDAYFIWANNDSNNQCCTAVGLYSLLLAVPNLNPSNFTASTMICANDQGDANLSFMVNRTAATASFLKIDCGSQFPANSTTDAYLLRIQINKTENQAQRFGKMTIYNIVTGHSFSYDFTGAQMPDSNANFAVMINRGNRNTGIATNTRPAKIHVTRKLF